MFKKLIKISIVTVTLLTVSASYARMPDHHFVCHVSTVSGIDGIVNIQAYNIGNAFKGASSVKAITSSDGYTKSQTKEVKECVEKPEVKFSDYQFQQFYNSLSDEYK